jgi:hypothetical protein
MSGPALDTCKSASTNMIQSCWVTGNRISGLTFTLNCVLTDNLDRGVCALCSLGPTFDTKLCMSWPTFYTQLWMFGPTFYTQLCMSGPTFDTKSCMSGATFDTNWCMSGPTFDTKFCMSAWANI